MLGQYGATDLALELTLKMNENDFDKELYDTFVIELGLDKPPVTRYFEWLGNVFQGDFGSSFSGNNPAQVSKI